ncbi:MAG: FHA domain-containing protein [Pseudomonadota bacterium]
MKRLRNVAVRMRPAVAAPPADPVRPTDPYRPEQGEHQAPAPTAQDAMPTTVPQAEPITPRRAIWDLDGPGDGPETTQHAPEPRLPEGPRHPPPPPAQSPVAQPPVAPPAGASHARTRILGFNAEELTSDAFATAEDAAATTPRFTAGWMVVVDGPGRGADFGVTAHVSNIGRGADQEIALDFGDKTISRDRHAAVVYDAEQNRFFLGHGNKANVVRRNGQPVLATEEMFDGDLIRIGKTTLRFVALCGPDFTWDDEDEDAHDG